MILDQKYNGEPVQVRVPMGKEPMHLMAIFKGKMVVYGVSLSARSSLYKHHLDMSSAVTIETENTKSLPVLQMILFLFLKKLPEKSATACYLGCTYKNTTLSLITS